jgi:hypothetical protein
MIISTSVGLFGPYGRIEEMGDRVRVWPAGAPDGHLGADLPFEVIGAYEVQDIEVPVGFVADDFNWIGGALVRKPSAE